MISIQRSKLPFSVFLASLTLNVRLVENNWAKFVEFDTLGS